jgi:hypothetical protein
MFTSTLLFFVATAAEPASLGQAVKDAQRTQSAVVDAVLKDKRNDGCARNLSAAGPSGLSCRLAVIAASTTKKSAADRAAIAQSALMAATDTLTYEGKANEEGIRLARFSAHRSAAELALAVVADVEAAPQKGVDVAALRKSACATVEKAEELGVSANVSLDEQSATHSIGTRHRCFSQKQLTIVDKGSAKEALRVGGGQSSEITKALDNGDPVRGTAVARGLDFQRCRDKADTTKVQECACGVVKRWKLPKDHAGPHTIPVVDDTMTMDLTLDAKGVVTSCGAVAAVPKR